jgi:hypothetical protein
LVIGQQVEGDEGSRAFFGQLCYAARRWMQPQLLDVKGFFTDDDLPVEDEAPDWQRPNGCLKLGEISAERLLIPGLQMDRVAVTEDDAAEAVPLWLELPASTHGQAVDRHGLHGLERKRNCERHTIDRRGQFLDVFSLSLLLKPNCLLH